MLAANSKLSAISDQLKIKRYQLSAKEKEKSYQQSAQEAVHKI